MADVVIQGCPLRTSFKYVKETEVGPRRTSGGKTRIAEKVTRARAYGQKEQRRICNMTKHYCKYGWS